MLSEVIDAIKNKNVDKNNFIYLQDQLCFDEDIIKAHEDWEKCDALWKEALKNNEDRFHIMNLASKVRMAKIKKDQVFDKAAHLAALLSEECGLIEEYDEDRLGKAKKIGDVEELSLDWHNLRREGIGGSSLSEALGFHWKSRPGDPVWMKSSEAIQYWKKMAVQKSAEVIQADNPSGGVLYRGHQWEPSLITRYAIENNKRVAMSKATWRGSNDFQVINVDGIVLDNEGDPEGLLECKTSSRDWTWQWGVPLHYRAQVLWYLNATGFKYADVIVKFDSGYIEVFRINYDETIDGSERTKTIPEYIDELEDKWYKYIQPLKDNPKLSWSEEGYLHNKEVQINNVIPNFRLNDKLEKVLDNADMVKAYISTPYDRMPSYYDILTSFETSDSNGRIYLDGVSPSFYPLDNDYVFAELQNREETFIEDYVSSSKIIAIDDMTYDYLVTTNGWPGVINLSDIRRIVEVNPNYPDFISLEEGEEWIISYLNNHN